MANTLVYPTHAILPRTIRRRATPQLTNDNVPNARTNGIVAAGTQQPWGPVDLGKTYFMNQQAIHAPILYDPNKEYLPSTNSKSIATSVYNISWNNTLGCITWNSRNFYLKPFSSGVSKDWTLASTVMEENTVARQVVKLTLTFASDDQNKGVVTTRLFIYPNCNMLRIQHNIAIPSGDLSDLGIQIVEAQLTDGKSNLGISTSAYNSNESGTWDGWVLSNNVFVSLRDAKETYPRGYSIGTTQSTDLSSPFLTGAVSWWEFNETSGNRLDSLGNNTLINYAGTWSRVTGQVGSPAYALSPTDAFNGMYVADNASLSITGDMTISVWVKLNSKTHFSTIISKYDVNQAAGRSYILWYNNSLDKFEFSVTSPAGALTTATHTLTPSVGNWYHIVCRHNNGANIKIRVSSGSTPGADVTQSFTAGINDGTSTFLVGNINRDTSPDSTGGYYLQGAVDDIVIWNRSLLDSEITTLNAAGQGYPFPATPVTNSGLKIYQHFTNGTRVNASDYTYANIAKLLYLHQGALNLTLPDEYVDALTNNSAIASEITEWSPTDTKNYNWAGVSSTLDMFVVFCENSSPPDSDLTFYHNIHQDGPIVSHIKVPGMKGQYFSEIETVIKRNILSWVGPWKGQFLHGDWRHDDNTLVRVRGQNHYQAISASWKNYLRTKDSEILKAARRQHRFFRDMCCRGGTFSHTGSLLPWVDGQVQEHHIDVQGLLLGWQIDGDRLSKDKFDLWRPSSYIATKDRDTENVLVEARILLDYLGQDYSSLAASKAAREANPTVPVDNNSDYWNPFWPSKEWMAQQLYLEINRAGTNTLYPSILYGTTNIHHNWLSRIAVDYPSALKPGQIGEGLLAYQWGEFCEECHRLKIHSFPFYNEMGMYPQKNSSTLEVIFTKPTSADLTFALTAGTNGGDPQQTIVKYQRPNGTIVTLKDSPNYFPVYPFIAYNGPVRGGFQETMTITGPAGQYRLQMTGTVILIYGPITPFPEYSIVQAGSYTKWAEGYFKPSAGGPVQFIQESSNANSPDRYSLAIFRSWPTAGYFAKYAEWLP